MTFLEICQTVRILSGAQGTGPTSVQEGDVSGYEVNLVHFVKTAYKDIQNSRKYLRFLGSGGNWNTLANVEEYSAPTIPNDIKNINALRIQINNKWRYLTELEVDTAERLFINTEESSEPKYFSWNPVSQSIKLYPTPPQAYPVHLDYYIKPEDLVNNEDTPVLPEEFHLLIVYKSLEKFSAFLGSPEIYKEYEREARVMYQRLWSNQVPSKKFTKPRRGRSFAI